jgi:hypothetical protein
MTEQEIYGAEQEFNRFEGIMNTQVYLTKEERDFCVAWDGDVSQELIHVDFNNGQDYLNTGVYSEHDHEKYDGDDCNNDLPF